MNNDNLSKVCLELMLIQEMFALFLAKQNIWWLVGEHATNYVDPAGGDRWHEVRMLCDSIASQVEHVTDTTNLVIRLMIGQGVQ